jgi:hypothetical protein
MGDLGQIVPMEWDTRNELQTEECLRHSHVVYNLVGREYETKYVHLSPSQWMLLIPFQELRLLFRPR